MLSVSETDMRAWIVRLRMPSDGVLDGGWWTEDVIVVRMRVDLGIDAIDDHDCVAAFLMICLVLVTICE